jgi:hypothetical protein
MAMSGIGDSLPLPAVAANDRNALYFGLSRSRIAIGMSAPPLPPGDYG